MGMKYAEYDPTGPQPELPPLKPTRLRISFDVQQADGSDIGDEALAALATAIQAEAERLAHEAGAVAYTEVRARAGIIRHIL